MAKPPAGMTTAIRSVEAADTAACGRIIYEAFSGISERHGFPPDFPSEEAGEQLASNLIANPSIFGVVAEADGRVVGSNFVSEGDPIRGVGPITVDPAYQRSGIGRRLMQAVLARGEGAAGIRLLQDAFNTSSIALYASLGFEIKEPVLLVAGKPESPPPSGLAIRPMTEQDVNACAAICERVHGFPRTSDVRDALQIFKPFVVERGGRIAGYLTSATFWLANHGVAETEQDMRVLMAGAATMTAEPMSFLLPVRQAGLFRWCLEHGMRVVKPMTLMAIGAYREPKGCRFPSVLY